MLEDLCENNSYEVLKRTEEDRSAWSESVRKKCQKPAVQQTTKEEVDCRKLHTMWSDWSMR